MSALATDDVEASETPFARWSDVGPASGIIARSMQPTTPQIGDVVAERYEIQSVLGRGGMGVVFAARHKLSGRRVALKWMEPEDTDEPGAKERFLREARAMGRIEHANVVSVLDVGEVGQAAYLVMEMLRGESLRAVIEREAPMPPARAIGLLLSAMEGVEAAHRAGVVHRDLKPENLFVTKVGEGGGSVTKVLDFGISKLDESNRSGARHPNLTKTGHVVGTPQYMSPEQVRGAAVDARTDVWALGTILYEMLTAKVPFEAENFGGLLVAIATEAFPPLYQRVENAPSALVVAVHRALEKDPASRHSSVLAFARALEPLAAGASFREPPAGSVVPPSPFAQTASTPSSLELDGGPSRTSKPTTPGKPQPQAGVPASGTDGSVSRSMQPRPIESAPPKSLAVTALARKSPANSERPKLDGGTVELPTQGPSSRLMLAIGAGVLCLLIAGAALAFRDGEAVGGEDPEPPPPVAAVAPPVAEPPPPVVVEPPTPPALPPAPEPTIVPTPFVAPLAESSRERPRAHAHTTSPTTTEAPPVVEAPPPTTTHASPSSRSGSISRDDF